VSIVGGDVMTDEEFRAFTRTVTRFNAIQIWEDTHLVEPAEVTAEEEGSQNHSCDSNLWMADEVTLVARRDITVGEELTVDYALFTTGPVSWIDGLCRCCSPHCRRVPGGDDWMLAEVQQRYRGHFSPFINERIAKRGVKARGSRQPVISGSCAGGADAGDDESARSGASVARQYHGQTDVRFRAGPTHLLGHDTPWEAERAGCSRQSGTSLSPPTKPNNAADGAGVRDGKLGLLARPHGKRTTQRPTLGREAATCWP